MVPFGLISLGFTELLVIGVLVIVFVGPDRLPDLMRFVGRQYGRLRRASDELRRAFQLEVDRVDADHRAEEIRRRREDLLQRRGTSQEETPTRAVARPEAPLLEDPQEPETGEEESAPGNGQEPGSGNEQAPESEEGGAS